MAKTLTLQQIADALGIACQGDPQAVISTVASIEAAGPTDVTFAVDERRLALLCGSRAAAAIVPRGASVPEGMVALPADHPEAALATVLGLLAEEEDLPPAGIHPTAIIDPGASVGEDVAIGPYVLVGPGATVGDRVVLAAGVSIGREAAVGDDSVLLQGAVVGHHCRLGRRCRLGPNAVIGGQGFGFYRRDGQWRRVPHIGTVQIGDDVEIGACSCVDRAKFGATRIADGTKLDNLVQIAHNVQLGREVRAAALVGVAGSTVIGDNVVLAGHVGVGDNITIGKDTQVGAYSAVTQSAAGGEAICGIYLTQPIYQHMRTLTACQSVPQLRKQVKELQARLDALESRTDDDPADR
ncbi:MAG: UDP-3-O-(3-hydroxymyristoyl)glucosamine N-acyltransferase [Planctomycetes bacterium]|nr:UDP-3-O-(3-hydroxymyristoyl)glucosamine N-acyltransferase [Planctomycetota bacterium]